jgi:anti-sigma factor RsiW
MHPCETDMDSYFRGSLATPDSTSIESHANTCRECCHRLAERAMTIARGAGDDSAVPTAPGRREQRQELRFPTEAPAVLRYINPVRDNRLPAQVLDVSRSGLKIETREFILPGTLVLIRARRMQIFGEVRYCVCGESGFRAGIRIERVE